VSKSFRKVLIALIILIPVILIGTGIYIRTLKPGNTEETRTPGTSSSMAVCRTQIGRANCGQRDRTSTL